MDCGEAVLMWEWVKCSADCQLSYFDHWRDCTIAYPLPTFTSLSRRQKSYSETPGVFSSNWPSGSVVGSSARQMDLIFPLEDNP